jgi:myosin heavy subunit
MGKKLKKKAHKKKKTSQRNYDSGRIDWGLGIRSSSDSESDSESLSGMNVVSSDVPAIFPCERDESDSETTELALMGEQEIYQKEAEFKRLSDIITDQQDLLNKRECEFEKVKELVKVKYQKLHDEVTSLKREVNEKNTTIKNLRDRSSDYESLEATILSLKGDLEKSRKENEDLHQAIEKQDNEVISLKSQLECAFRVRQMQQNVSEEQEKEIFNLRQQVEEGRKSEEILKKQCLEKDEQHQVEVNILKGKIEEKDKLLRFQDSSKVLDDILSSQRSPAIKTGLGFHESVEGESSSQGEARNSKEKSKVIKEEKKDPSHHQPRKEIPQRKSFTPMNNVECYVCHNLGHVAARCRRRRVQDHYAERSSQSRYFYGYCFACNMFGHKATDCYRRNMKHIRCYACNKLGHIAKECRNKVWAPYQKEKMTSSRLKIWRKKEVQSEKGNTAHHTDIPESEGAEGSKLQCPESHMQIP